MARLEAAAAWFFSCLGVVLLGCSILVVPANAFADSGNNCYTQCGGDPTCMATCCQAACANDPDPTTCYNNCMAQQTRPCNQCESGTACFSQSGGVCDNSNQFCNAFSGCTQCKCRAYQSACYCK